MVLLKIFMQMMLYIQWAAQILLFFPKFLLQGSLLQQSFISRAEPARLSFSLYYIFGIMRKIVCQSRNNGKTRMDGPFWLWISSKSPIFFDQKTTIHTAYHHLMHNIIVTISYLIGNRYDLTITDSFSFQHSFVCFLHHFLLSSRIATFHAIYR